MLARDHPLARYAQQVWPRGLLAALIDFQATSTFRLEAVKRLLPLGIQVWGDESWKFFIPADRFHGPVAYGNLQQVYRRSVLTLNVSRFQLVSSVTQRHFDAPLCGALLLTDERPGLGEYFAPGDEVLVYRSFDELESVAREALDDSDGARERVRAMAARARERTLREHTYTHRLDSLDRIVRDHRARLESVGGASFARSPALRERCDAFFGPWIDQNQTELARRVIDRLLETNPEDCDLLAWSGGCDLVAGKVSAAEKTLSMVLEREPKHRVARGFTLMAALRQGKLEEAARIASGLYRDFPERPEYAQLVKQLTGKSYLRQA